MPSEIVTRRDRVIAPDERERFWKQFAKLPLKGRTRVGLALFTGARAGEIDMIQARDVNPERMTVRREIFKKAGGAQERTVRVPETLMKDLLAWIEEAELGPDDRLFSPRCQSGVKFLQRWRTSMRGLRRTVLTDLHNSGAPLRVIQETAGHSKLDTTQRYLHVEEGAVNDALASLSWGKVPVSDPTDRVGSSSGLAVGVAVNAAEGADLETARSNTIDNTASRQTTTEQALTRQEEEIEAGESVRGNGR